MAIRKAGWRWRITGAMLTLAVMWGGFVAIRPADQVVLTIGEPYEQVRQQSRSTLPIATQDNSIDLHVKRPAALRFSDIQYGFVTPAAKFLSIYADAHGYVRSITLSPQVETLPLDATMAILLDLQNQLQRGGWRPILVGRHPPMMDTPQTRALMRANLAPQTFWLAGNKYQVSIDVRRFVHENRPADERYLITLQLSGPPLMEDRPNE
ncbi:flagellar biosynthesis sigma factor [Burkholderia ubonensis]|nr:flagellar biosynthesis sigma factor [Burkholderia ubonensis]RQP32873.1 flagellar biosynthesis sigma factor [Burkholderia ubonensis]RQP35644.1 flagellar biosynthesis sigma factor [Burkholderia ubonensis]RQP50311.1 flagellar biosynthesis sigma factor [Burkholderia ubonensis]RQP54944.1 flagellar biosynthesis sigma factor [Burkholderia ubonensis]